MGADSVLQNYKFPDNLYTVTDIMQTCWPSFRLVFQVDMGIFQVDIWDIPRLYVESKRKDRIKSVKMIQIK